MYIGNKSRVLWGALRPRRTSLAILTLLLLSGCASLDQNFNTPKPVQLPGNAPVTTGNEMPEDQEHVRLVTLFGGEYFHAPAERLLAEVLRRLADAGEVKTEPYRLTLLNSAVVNAFALPSGRIYVTRGLLALANDTSEVAAVMAHEIAHVTAKHASQRAELEKDSALVSKAASIIQNPEKGQEVQAYRRLTLASFSRGQEFEADRLGVTNMAHAGYDPYGAARFLTSLGHSASLRASLIGQARSNNARPDILSSHPSTPERIREAISAARQIAAPDTSEKGHDAYLAAIDGIVFGDDPSEGVIRSNRFTHPKLGFTFTAPAGFVLENSAQALLGMSSAGTDSLRLDSVQVSAGTSLEAYVRSGWIDGLDEKSITNNTVNDLPAVFAIARDGDWTFKLVVIRFGSEVYRLIFATKNLNAETDQKFNSAMNSFRRISTQEAAQVKPLKISIVKASASDTFASMAGRTAGLDRGEDYFRLLNGLTDVNRLTPGTSYKIITE
eukprot:gene10097-10166_t